MTKRLIGLFAGAAIVVGAGAASANIQVRDGTGNTQSLLTATFNGAQAYLNGLIDTTGAQINPATKEGQATNTAAITATNAATGTVAASSQTVTMTLPQLSPTAGNAISFGTTSTALFNANGARRFIQIQVQGSTGGCYINGTAAATQDANSLYIPAGGYFESSTHVGVTAINIICTQASTPVWSRQG